MKLLKLLPLCITIAYALVYKEKNIISNDIEGFTPTTTTNEPTRLSKRAKTTNFEFIKNYTIFMEGDKTWNEDWVTQNWGDIDESDKVVNGVIKIYLKNDAAFSLINTNLESQYGEINFDYKLESSDGQPSRLNFISFYENDYINQGNWEYEGNGKYEHKTQIIKDWSKNTFIPRIQRFAWQNWGNTNEFTLYLKNIIYTDMKVIVMKYDDPVPILNTDKCTIHSGWKDISKDTSKTKFNLKNGVCEMTINPSYDNPTIFKLDEPLFKGGKLEITLKSTSSNSIFTWYAINSEDSSVKQLENSSIYVDKTYVEYNNEEFESDKLFDSLKISPIEGEITFYITKLVFYPISDETSESYQTTHIDEPDVILDENGLHWQENSWSSTCNFQSLSSAMVCTFQGSWGAFSFSTQNYYNAGTLYINMKVSNPERQIQIQTHHPNGSYVNIHTFKATDEYLDYYISVPNNEQYATNRFAIQEASQQENTYYIRKIIYYPPYIDISNGTTSPKTTTKSKTTTKTKTKTKTVSPQEPTLPPKTNEEEYQDNGYNGCPENTKITYAENTKIYGLVDNQWCAILEKNIKTCWSSLYGFKCCSKDAEINGAWGTEVDGSKCGNTASGTCWSKELGYDCCSISESDEGVVLVDEFGAWGVKNNKWCGIK